MEGHLISPQPDSVAYAEQQTCMDYGVPSFVVSDAAWIAERGEKAPPSFAAGGQIYMREALTEECRGLCAAHELTHVMWQLGFKPYQDFLERTPEMLNMNNRKTLKVLDRVEKHVKESYERAGRGSEASLDNEEFMQHVYDELNATVWGHICAGESDAFTDGSHKGIFLDFQAYAEELQAIHEQFKAENRQGRAANTPELPDMESELFSVPRPPADGNAAELIEYGEEQTTASLGIPGGSRTDRIRLVTAGETISSNMAGGMAFENDLHLQLFGGGNLHIGGRAVQAYINDGIAYVRVDAPNKTSAQLMRELMAPLQPAQEETRSTGMPLEPDDLFNKQEIDAINAEIQAELQAEMSGEMEGVKSSGMAKSGAISGALNPQSEAAEAHAVQYYEAVRKMTTDVKRIAQNTGYSESQIQRIKNFLFMDSHDLGDGEIARFFPDYDIACSWQRLIDGKKILQHDITLLKHELMEAKLMASGLSQDRAHRIASSKYCYEREVSEYNDKTKKHKNGG